MFTPNLLRPAGHFEHFHISRHFLGLDSGVLCSARYTNADGATLTKELLFFALKKVIQIHPSLAVRLEAEGSSRPLLVKLNSIELSLVVKFTDNNDLEAAMQRQLSTPFDTRAQLPLWRVEVLKDGTVVFIFHHAIGDGLSGVAFHQSLLAALQKPIAGDVSPLALVPRSHTPLRPIEDVTSLWPSLRKFFSELFTLFAPTSWTPGYWAWTANPVPRTTDLSTHVKLITFTAPEMTAFAKVCRAHGATITSALYVLATATASRLVPPGKPQYKTLSAAVAISLRDVARAPAAAMCDYASVHRTFPPVNPAFSWPTAAACAAELQRQKITAREEIGMLRFLFGNITGFLRGKLGAKRGGTFEVSNLGRVVIAPAGEVGPWRIGRMVFAQCDVVIGAALKVSVIGDPTGEMTVAVTWGDAAIERALVETFTSQFQDGLRALIV
ncbi:alcohol acetyltransferase [Mycena galericulata]|nr:alcohol acetyltransferase [Mycena galericulata]